MTRGRTLIQQSETFTGVLTPFTGSMLTRTRAGFDAMNVALARQTTGSATHVARGPPAPPPETSVERGN